MSSGLAVPSSLWPDFVSHDWLQRCETAISRANLVAGERIRFFAPTESWHYSVGVSIGESDYEIAWHYPDHHVNLRSARERGRGADAKMSRSKEKQLDFSEAFAALVGPLFAHDGLGARDFAARIFVPGSRVVRSIVADRVGVYVNNAVVMLGPASSAISVWGCKASGRVLLRCPRDTAQQIQQREQVVFGHLALAPRATTIGDRTLLSADVGVEAVEKQVLDVIAGVADVISG